MRNLLIVLTIFASNAMAGTALTLTYQDSIKVNQTVFKNSLPEHLINLHRLVKFEDQRMIAGDFEKVQKNKEKKTYLDGLRSKLEGCKGLSRF